MSVSIQKIENKADAGMLWRVARQTFIERWEAESDPADFAAYVSENLSFEHIEEELLHSENHFFILFYEEEPAGYAKLSTLKTHDMVRAMNPIKLERIYLYAKYQNKKLGKQLMQFLENYARNLGHGTIWLGVYEKNYAALAFYHSVGFFAFAIGEFHLAKSVEIDILLRKNI